MVKTKRTKKDLQNNILKIGHATRTSLKTNGELECSGRVRSSCSICYTRRGWVYDEEFEDTKDVL